MKKLLLLVLFVLGSLFGFVNAEGEAQGTEQPAAQAPVEAEASKTTEAPEASAQTQEEPAQGNSDTQKQEEFENMMKELNEMMRKEGQEGSAE